MDRTLEEQLRQELNNARASLAKRGICPTCDGTGTIYAGWHHQLKVVMFQECAHCGGSGYYEDAWNAAQAEIADLRDQLAATGAERDALRRALEQVHDMAERYCHLDISDQIKFDYNAALNRILEITEGGAS